MVTLEGLAVYLNCNSPMYSALPVVDIIHNFRKEIASKDEKPENYKYGKFYKYPRNIDIHNKFLNSTGTNKFVC